MYSILFFDDETAQQARNTIQKDYGKTVVCVKGDTKDSGTVEKYFQAIKEHFNNHLTVLVHHAGGWATGHHKEPKPTGDSDPDYWLRWSDAYYKMYASSLAILSRKH